MNRVVSLVIGKDEQDVGLLLLLFLTGINGNNQKENN
jgi:hypothetical protein